MPANMIPQDPIVNAGLLYVNGLQVSNDAALPDSVINVAVGQCRDSTNTNDIFINAVYNTNVVPPVLVSNFVAASTAFVGVGGLDSGAVAANTSYAVYVIGSSANMPYLVNYAPINQVPPIELPFSKYPGAVILSTNFTAPALPYGYDMFRRVGSIRTDGTSNILAFTQLGNGSGKTVLFASAIPVLAAGQAVNYTAVPLAAFMPSVATTVLLSATLTPHAAGDVASFQPTGAAAGATYAAVSASVAAVAQVSQVYVPCNAAASISYKLTVNTDTLALGLQGYVDQL